MDREHPSFADRLRDLARDIEQRWRSTQTEQGQREELDKRRLETQAAPLVRILQEDVEPLLQEVNTAFLGKTGVITKRYFEPDSQSILLSWEGGLRDIGASILSTDKDFLIIRGGSGPQEKFDTKRGEWRKQAEDYILLLLDKNWTYRGFPSRGSDHDMY